MTAAKDGISLMRKREIGIGITAPLVRAFAVKTGKERAFSIAVRDVDRALARNVVWDDNEEFRFGVTHCALAELYRETGCEEIENLLPCGRDETFLEGFNDSPELVGIKTIMAGDGVCDFFYMKKGKE